MSYLLFLDESGHDHKRMPYELHGGIAVHASRLWSLTRAIHKLEEEAFGTHLHLFGSELKGEKLLDKDRFKWAAQGEAFTDDWRRTYATAFLQKSKEKEALSRREFTAYGQASLLLAEQILDLLPRYSSMFVSAFPRGVRPGEGYNLSDLRRDYVQLFDRYGRFLAERQESGLIIMDQIEQSEDRRTMQRVGRYFGLTKRGQHHARHLVPIPFFVSSDMGYATQAADLCLYTLNWGYRATEIGMEAPVRQEITDRFGHRIERLLWKPRKQKERSRVTGLAYLPDPYQKALSKKES